MNTNRNSAWARRMGVAFMAGGMAAAVHAAAGSPPSSSNTGSSAGSGEGSSSSGANVSNNSDPYAHLPSTLVLKGVVRDFIEKGKTGGHPDFELDPASGFGHYVGMCKNQLDKDGNPEFNGTGFKVSTEAKDASGRNVIPSRDYIAAREGDSRGAMASSQGGASTSAERFAQWYRDVPGVNVSKNIEITLVRQPNTNMYTFNDKTDSLYKSRNGFFPINGDLFGNSGGSTPNQNFHFTYEVSTEFIYEKNKGQVFTFTGDDDVWVFIHDKLAIDLGGVHGEQSASIDLDANAGALGITKGNSYAMDIFHAERHTTQSNFRIDTTIACFIPQ